jgi:hypothetical protein
VNMNQELFQVNKLKIGCCEKKCKMSRDVDICGERANVVSSEFYS